MEIRKEDDVIRSIESWKQFSSPAQAMRARQAIEKLELNQMYHDQKGKDNSAQRAGRCIELLKEYLAKIGT